MKIGRISLVDPAAKQDKLGPEIERVISSIFSEPSTFVPMHVPNEPRQLRAALIRLCDEEKCPLVLTLGGTGPGPNDIVPDVTLEVLDRKLPGFGEVMRYYSYERFKVSVLSGQPIVANGQSQGCFIAPGHFIVHEIADAPWIISALMNRLFYSAPYYGGEFRIEDIGDLAPISVATLD